MSPIILTILLLTAAFQAPQEDINTRIQRMSAIGSNPSLDYRLGPGDLLEISVFGVDKFNQATRVSSSGQISVPFIGKLSVSGLTSLELEEKITSLMTEKKLILNPQVSVFVKEYRSQPVFVLGAVKQPGQFMITQPLRVIDVLAMAGGIDLDRAGEYALLQRRGEQAAASRPAGASASGGNGGDTVISPPGSVKINLHELLETGSIDLNMPVQGGDVIQVPERQIDLFYVIGEVAKPGAYEWPIDQKHVLLSQALAWAGGPLKTAKLSGGTLVRYDEKGGRQEMLFDFAQIIKGKKPDLSISARDVIFIPGSNMKTIGYGLLGVIPNTASGMMVYSPRRTSY